MTGSTVYVDGSKENLLALIANKYSEAVENLPRITSVTNILKGMLTTMSRVVNSETYKLNTGKRLILYVVKRAYKLMW